MGYGDTLPTSIDPGAADIGAEFRKLIGPAIQVIEAALTSRDEKLKIETAKWYLSCFPETSPKKGEGDKGAIGGTTFNIANFNLDQFSSRFQHIAEGVMRLKDAEYKISGEEKLLPVHRKGDR